MNEKRGACVKIFPYTICRLVFNKYSGNITLFSYQPYGKENITTGPLSISENHARLILAHKAFQYFYDFRMKEIYQDPAVITEFKISEIGLPKIRLCIHYPNYDIDPVKKKEMKETLFLMGTCDNPFVDKNFYDPHVVYEIKTRYKLGGGGYYLDENQEIKYGSDLENDESERDIFDIEGHIDAYSGEYIGGSHSRYRE